LEQFHPETSKAKEAVVIEKGSGTQLKNIPSGSALISESFVLQSYAYACSKPVHVESGNATVVQFVRDHAIKKSDPKDPLKVISKLLFNRQPQVRNLAADFSLASCCKVRRLGANCV
jgi:predicted nicotinamide N-methyase